MESTQMTAVRLPAMVREKLDQVAMQTGRTRTRVVLDALAKELEIMPGHAERRAPVFSSLETMLSEN